jgi:hypothetical protein
LPKKKVKTSDNVVYDLVNVWTSEIDEDKIRREVHRWTRPKSLSKEEISA